MLFCTLISSIYESVIASINSIGARFSRNVSEVVQ